MKGRSGAPTDLEFEKALMYFHAYMFGPLQGKLRIYRARGTPPAGARTMPSDWEVFASILVRDVGRKLAAGIDLSNYEVKSAATGRSYEYQYHRVSGKKKLRQDMRVGHLFFEHGLDLRLVHLRYARGSQLRTLFSGWLRDYPDPYPQRYRRNVPYAWVIENAKLLMTLRDGEVEYPEPPGAARAGEG
jgi:hypothetical protein